MDCFWREVQDESAVILTLDRAVHKCRKERGCQRFNDRCPCLLGEPVLEISFRPKCYYSQLVLTYRAKTKAHEAQISTREVTIMYLFTSHIYIEMTYY